jgi:hypothetical protein
MANNKNSNYKYLNNTKVTLPLNETATGTASTNGIRIDGVLTAFRTELQAGSWLVDLTNDEIRQVDSVVSDTVAYLTEPFTADLVLGAFEIIKKTNCNVVSISVQVLSGAAADAYVDGELFPKGASMTFSKDSRDTNRSKDFVDPIVFDATGTTAMVQFMK